MMKKYYHIWSQMKQRCYNPKHKKYKNYGGRGITMCQRWIKSYKNFEEDMGERPSCKHSIDRIDNDKGYCKENCKWSTNQEQCSNRRSNHIITCNGKTMSLTDWAKELGIHISTLHTRIVKCNYDYEKAINYPVKPVRCTVKYRGEERFLHELAKEYGIHLRTLRSRIFDSGWSVEEAVSTPVNSIRKNA